LGRGTPVAAAKPTRMFRKSFFYNVLIAVLTVVLVVGGFSSFQRKRSSFERLDFRWRWDKGVIVVTEVVPGSGAEQAGLRAEDRIWVVGGAPSSEVDGLRKTLRRSSPLPLVITRGDQTHTLTYTAPPLKIDYHYLFLTFIGFLYLAIGLFTLVRGRQNESLLFYFVSLLAFVVYVYSPDRGGKLDDTFKALWLVEEFARIFLPPLALHFFLRFPRPLLSHRGVIAAIYVLPALLALWVIDLFLFDNAIPLASPERSFQILERWEMFHFAVYFTFAFVALTYTFRTAQAIGQKKQIKWIYLGMAVGFIPFLILYLIPYIGTGTDSAYTTVAILPLAFIPLAFAVSILKYKLWDVEVVIKEVLAYTVTFIFGMVAFSTVNLLLSKMIEEQLALERNFLAFASGLLIAGVLIPVKSRIENLLEMFFYGETYRHRRAIADFAQELGSYHDLHDLIEMIRERLSAAIHIHRTNLYLHENERYVIYEQVSGAPMEIGENEIGEVSADRPLVLDRPGLPEASEIKERLIRAGYRYVFPLRHRNELLAMLVCGNKQNEEPLSRDDLQLIGSLTAPLSLAIENARLYGRLRRQLDQIQSLKDYNENIIESSSSAIVVAAEDGTVLTANRAFWDLIGIEPGLDKTIDEIFPEAKPLRRELGRTREITFVNRRGQEKTVAASASAFTADEAPVGTLVLVISDVSERVRLERQLQDKERLAALGLLAAGVAHEMNTPLTGISSYAQLLLAELPPDDPRRSVLKKMEIQTFRASHLVNNLLDFAANRPRAVERVNLAEVVRSTLAIHEDLLKNKEIRLHVGELPNLLVDATDQELQQVLTNLLLNARDAVSRRGNIWIELREAGEQAVLAVRDDGRGIHPELQQRIFQPLVTTKGGRGGTGLGLAIVDRIVRGLGGEITLQSSPGKGATFSVHLPLVRDGRVVSSQ
jgi:two-component system NtrC family sensor kinase